VGCAIGHARRDELEILVTLAEAYERQHYPIDLPDPIEAVKFRLEQQGKKLPRALIGSSANAPGFTKSCARPPPVAEHDSQAAP